MTAERLPHTPESDTTKSVEVVIKQFDDLKLPSPPLTPPQPAKSTNNEVDEFSSLGLQGSEADDGSHSAAENSERHGQLDLEYVNGKLEDWKKRQEFKGYQKWLSELFERRKKPQAGKEVWMNVQECSVQEAMEGSGEAY